MYLSFFISSIYPSPILKPNSRHAIVISSYSLVMLELVASAIDIPLMLLTFKKYILKATLAK
jgi:hypothetical protein